MTSRKAEDRGGAPGSRRAPDNTRSWGPASNPSQKLLNRCQDMLPSAIKVQVAAPSRALRACPGGPAPAHLQVGLLQPVVHQLRVALLLLQLLLQLGDAGLQAPLLLQRQGPGGGREGVRGARPRGGDPTPTPAVTQLNVPPRGSLTLCRCC